MFNWTKNLIHSSLASSTDCTWMVWHRPHNASQNVWFKPLVLDNMIQLIRQMFLVLKVVINISITE